MTRQCGRQCFTFSPASSYFRKGSFFISFFHFLKIINNQLITRRWRAAYSSSYWYCWLDRFKCCIQVMAALSIASGCIIIGRSSWRLNKLLMDYYMAPSSSSSSSSSSSFYCSGGGGGGQIQQQQQFVCKSFHLFLLFFQMIRSNDKLCRLHFSN